MPRGLKPPHPKQGARQGQSISAKGGDRAHSVLAALRYTTERVTCWQLRSRGMHKDPEFLLQQGAKSPECGHGSSYFPSVVFPANLCRRWHRRWEWGKAFLDHLVYLFDKADIFPPFSAWGQSGLWGSTISDNL